MYRVTVGHQETRERREAMVPPVRLELVEPLVSLVQPVALEHLDQKDNVESQYVVMGIHSSD